MADHSHIEWTDATWNPVTGCSVVSPGCIRCYAMKLAGTRLKHHPSRANLTIMTKAGPVWNGAVRFNREWLLQPLEWKRPRMIFVCAHGDLFHESVPDEWLDEIFAVMALATHHTFQVLTKRAARMQAYLSDPATPLRIAARLYATGRENGELRYDDVDKPGDTLTLRVFPLRNVWFGVSTERQQEADERIPLLHRTPAAIRFLSAEPLLGPIDLSRKMVGVNSLGNKPIKGLDWIIAGGESGAGARPMHPVWARSLRDQCRAACVPFFFKQWGAWVPIVPGHRESDQGGRVFSSNHEPGDKWFGRDGHFGDDPPRIWAPAEFAIMRRVGKKIAGRLLDGVKHDGMPSPQGIAA